MSRTLGAVSGGVIGGLFFVWIAGWRIIDPARFEWLMKLDWRINFLGWHLFRNDPWRLPPGIIEGYLAGEGTTIGLTDAVPLPALVLKPFDPWLPTPFQYIGLWLLVCFVLQGVFGALLTGLWTRQVALRMAGAALFVLVPTLLMRVGHPALTAHFLLLWALWIYFKSDRHRPASWQSQAALGACAGLIHPYLAAMTLTLLASLPLRAVFERVSDPSSHRGAAGVWAAFATAVAATLAAWWAAGFISVSSTSDLAAGGLGLYSMNLLSPITPGGWSSLLPELPVAHEWQAYEGFQYLGAGIIALLVCATVLSVVRPRRVPSAVVVPILLVCTVSAMYALSPRVTAGASVLVDWSSPALDRVAFFRASGRFFWPMTYLMLTAAIAAVVSRLHWRVALATLGVVVAVQVVDLRPAHAERRATSRSDAFHHWPRQLQSTAWHAILPHYARIVMVPASQCGGAPLEHEELAFLAGLHGLTINSGLGARWDEMARRRYCVALESAIARGDVDGRTLYVVTPEHEQRLRSAATPVVCGPLDAARICVSAASYEPWRSVLELNE